MPTSAVLNPVDAIAKRLFRCQNGASRKIRYAFATSFTIWLYFTVTTYSKINRHHDLIGMKTPIALDSYKESRVNTGRSETRRTSIRYRSQQSMSNVTKEATKTSWGSDFEAAEQNRKKNNCTVHHSYEDIKRCVPPERRKNMTLMMKPGDPPCDTITTWSDIQRCVNGPTAPKPVVELERMRINLIGERNSGTKWIVEEMQKCFPKEKFGVKIERDLYGRNKHFFQLTGRNSLQRRHVVVSVFRDPVEWVAAMIEKPYHMPYHMQGFDDHDKPIPLDWKDFVNRSWSMPNRSRQDFALLDEMKQRPFKHFMCRSGLAFHEAMPCRFDAGTIPDRLVRAHNPVYELRRGGTNDEPYRTILELRSDKIINFLLEVPILQDLGGYLAVRFEDLLLNGTRTLLEQVAEMVGIEGGLPRGCHPQGPKPEVIGRRTVPAGLKQWVEDHLVLQTERLLGYR